MKNYLVHCPKRRAHRPGCIPAEVLLMLLEPNWRLKDDTRGLGAARNPTGATLFVRKAEETGVAEPMEGTSKAEETGVA